MSNRDYLLLIYTCMCIILFLMMIILSFQSHQIRMLSAGLGMAWNRYCPVLRLLHLWATKMSMNQKKSCIVLLGDGTASLAREARYLYAPKKQKRDKFNLLGFRNLPFA